MKNACRKFFSVLYKICLVAFMILGIIIVVAQLIGSVIGSGVLVNGVSSALGTISIVAAALCALAAFIFSYLRDKKTDGQEKQMSKE